MKQKSGRDKAPAEQVLKDIRRQTRRQYSAEEKIRIVLEGLRGEENISELCRREGIAASMYYGASQEFLEAGKRRLAGDTARAATSGEVKDLRREATASKEVVADLTLENRLLKKSMSGDGRTRHEVSCIREGRDYPAGRAIASAGQAHLGQLGIPRATFYRWYDRYLEGGPEALGDHAPDQIVSGTGSRTMSAARSSLWHWRFLSCRRGGRQCASPTSKSTLSRRLRSIGY